MNSRIHSGRKTIQTYVKVLSAIIIVFSVIVFALTLVIIIGLMALSMFTSSSAALPSGAVIIAFLISSIPIILVILSATVFKNSHTVQLVLHIIGIVLLAIYLTLIASFVLIRNGPSEAYELKEPPADFFEDSGTEGTEEEVFEIDKDFDENDPGDETIIDGS